MSHADYKEAICLIEANKQFLDIESPQTINDVRVLKKFWKLLFQIHLVIF